MDTFRIRNFPISFFSLILGFCGLTISFQRTEKILDPGFFISDYLLGFTLLLFLIISSVYIIKIIFHFDSFKLERNHPIKINFFPTFSISFLLFSIAFLEINEDVSCYLWYTGAILHLLFTFDVATIWLQHEKFDINHINPAWFIPVVGNILVPIAGVTHVHEDISWFFFSVGLFFYLVLFTIFIYRMIFHNPLPEKLVPTFFINVAPPAIGFIAYVKLTGTVDNFAKILYLFGFFTILLILFQYKLFYRIKFYLSWWAYSFPIAAFTISSLLMFKISHLSVYKYIAIISLILLSSLIILLIVKTIHSMVRKEICVEDD